MTEPHETHNELARDFVTLAGTRTHSHVELMVLSESVMLATMTLMVRLHSINPSHASIYMECALQAATERFAETQ